MNFYDQAPYTIDVVLTVNRRDLEPLDINLCYIDPTHPEPRENRVDVLRGHSTGVCSLRRDRGRVRP